MPDKLKEKKWKEEYLFMKKKKTDRKGTICFLNQTNGKR